MVDKICRKDAKRGSFSYQMGFRKRSYVLAQMFWIDALGIMSWLDWSLGLLLD